MRPVLDAFQRVGTSRPLLLTTEQEGTLADVIEDWATRFAGGYPELPEGIFELRNAIVDDLPERPLA
jgi:hypothetical protein